MVADDSCPLALTPFAAHFRPPSTQHGERQGSAGAGAGVRRRRHRPRAPLPAPGTPAAAAALAAKRCAAATGCGWVWRAALGRRAAAQAAVRQPSASGGLVSPSANLHNDPHCLPPTTCLVQSTSPGDRPANATCSEVRVAQGLGGAAAGVWQAPHLRRCQLPVFCLVLTCSGTMTKWSACGNTLCGAGGGGRQLQQQHANTAARAAAAACSAPTRAPGAAGSATEPGSLSASTAISGG